MTEGRRDGQTGGYDELCRRFREAEASSDTRMMQSMAMMAVADRLDRLCEIVSKRR